MIRGRLDGGIPFTRGTISYLADLSNGIPRRMLELCEKVCIEFAGNPLIEKNEAMKALGKTETKNRDKRDKDKILKKLSPSQRKLIKILKKKGKLTAKEIADEMDTSIGSVRKQLSRLSPLVIGKGRPKEWSTRKT